MQEKLTEELYNLSEQVRSIDEEWRSDSDDIRKLVQRLSNIKKEQTNKLESLFEDLDVVKAQQEEYQQRAKRENNEVKAKLQAQIEERPSLSEVQKALHTQQQDLTNRINYFKDEIRNEVKAGEGKKDPGSKADLYEHLQKSKVSYSDFEELKKIVHKLCIDQDERITQKEFAQHIKFTKGVLDVIQKDVLLKASIKDVCQLIDSKSNIEDVNTALTSIHKELDQKPTYDDLSAIVKKQAQVNDSLCEENIVARFQWRSGDLKSGQTVPWEHQIINTLPDNYIWEKDKSSILTVAPGVYQVSLHPIPSLDLLRLLLQEETQHPAPRQRRVRHLHQRHSSVNSLHPYPYSPQSNPSSFKMKSQSYSNITGITLNDFIVLPARSRLSIVYDGDSTAAEGFLSLKRL